MECFWLVRDRKRSKREPDRILPDGCPEWIVHVQDVFARQVDARWIEQPKSFLAGTLSRPWLLRAGERVCTLGIRFKPGALAILFDWDLSKTADREIDIVGRLGSEARLLVSAICKQRSARAMFAAAEKHLHRLASSRFDRVPASQRAVDRIRSSRGRLRVESLAKSIGTSRRTLERVFRRELGISPKQYARIVRLNAVLESLSVGERARVTELALDAGYFDEAHLSRDFRKLAGRRATSKQPDGELARQFTRPERLRALLFDTR